MASDILEWNGTVQPVILFTAVPSSAPAWVTRFSPVEISLSQNHRICAQDFDWIEPASTPPRMS
jgi:hypothetical protein